MTNSPKLGYSCNAITLETEAGGSHVIDQAETLSEVKASVGCIVKPCLKNKTSMPDFVDAPKEALSPLRSGWGLGSGRWGEKELGLICKKSEAKRS